MMADLKEAVLRVLPALSDHVLTSLVHHLGDCGVEDESDLQFVEESDLKELLKPIQCRKLLQAWRKQDESVTEVDGDSLSPTSPASDQGSSTDRSHHQHQGQTPLSSSTPANWHTTMQIPWDDMPHKLKEATKNKKRPKPSDRRIMVRKVVDAMRQHHPNPNKAQCASIADRLVSQYPDSFADRTHAGDTLGCGYYSLLMQIKTRVEHVNRNNSAARLRKVRRRIVEGVPEASSGPKPTDMYGCVRWQPESPPDGDSTDSLERKREELVQLFSQNGPTGGNNIALVDQLMQKTYFLQRQHINNNAPISELRLKWPFLFQDRWLCAHFESLTGVPIFERLMQAFLSKGERIRNFVLTKQTRNVQSVSTQLSSGTDTEVDINAGTVLLLMAYFEEEEEELLLLVDPTATTVEIEDRLLPVSPRLIVKGDTILTGSKFCVTFDGHAVAEVSGPFVKGFALLFASFYIWNMEYQETAARTLEFIQRSFLSINPEKGTKCASRRKVSTKSGREVQRKTETVNSRVATFVKDLADFEWL